MFVVDILSDYRAHTLLTCLVFAELMKYKWPHVPMYSVILSLSAWSGILAQSPDIWGPSNCQCRWYSFSLQSWERIKISKFFPCIWLTTVQCVSAISQVETSQNLVKSHVSICIKAGYICISFWTWKRLNFVLGCIFSDFMDRIRKS